MNLYLIIIKQLFELILTVRYTANHKEWIKHTGKCFHVYSITYGYSSINLFVDISCETTENYIFIKLQNI